MSIILALCLVLAFSPSALAQQFSIDSPLPGSVQSGTVAPPNGWRCNAGTITASIDGGPIINFTEDQNRGDTAGPCSNNGDNAFIIAQPWNWNIFGSGTHTVTFFDDGAQFAAISFTIETFGTEFLLGPTASFTVQDFPDPGADVVVSWDAAIQNFRITEVREAPDTGDCEVQTKTAEVQMGRSVFDLTVRNLCSGDTLEISFVPLASASSSLFVCLIDLDFVQDGIQFTDAAFSWTNQADGEILCEFFLIGLTVNTDFQVDPGVALDLRRPFSVFYSGDRILDFP